MGFHGDSVGDLETAFKEAVDDHVETCAKVGKSPERPYSGRVMFRIDPQTHAKAALAAEMRGISLNEWADDTTSKQAMADLEMAGAKHPIT